MLGKHANIRYRYIIMLVSLLRATAGSMHNWTNVLKCCTCKRDC